MILQLSCDPSAINATRPQLNVTYDNGLFFEGFFNVDFLVMSSTEVDPKVCYRYTEGGYLCSAFELQLYLGVNLTVVLTEGASTVEISSQVKDLLLDWLVAESNVGNINVGILDTLDTLFSSTIVAKIDALLAEETFSISTSAPPFSFTNFAMTFVIPESEDGYICFTANINDSGN